MKVRIFFLLLASFVFPQGALAAVNDGIGWLASWNQALAEARQTNKPILLMSGAPECGGVPGVW